MVCIATSALSLISWEYSPPRNLTRYSPSLDWLATAARASCLTMSSSFSFSRHSLIKCSRPSHPTCPIMKQTSCLSRLVCVQKYSRLKRRHSVSRHSGVLRFLMQYMRRYLKKRGISCSQRSPKKPCSLKRLAKWSEPARKAQNSSLLNGAAGSIVFEQSFPYSFSRFSCKTFSFAIWHVHLNSLHSDSRCLSQLSTNDWSKQFASASAASCRERAFSCSSSIFASRNSLTWGYMSLESWPRAQRSQCLRRMEFPQEGQAWMREWIAGRVARLLSSKTAWQRRPMGCAESTRVWQKGACMSVDTNKRIKFVLVKLQQHQRKFEKQPPKMSVFSSVRCSNLYWFTVSSYRFILLSFSTCTPTFDRPDSIFLCSRLFHANFAIHGCCITSPAPPLLPSLDPGCLIINLLMKSIDSRDHPAGRSCFFRQCCFERIASRISALFCPEQGLLPIMSSKQIMPKAQKSTGQE